MLALATPLLLQTANEKVKISYLAALNQRRDVGAVILMLVAHKNLEPLKV